MVITRQEYEEAKLSGNTQMIEAFGDYVFDMMDESKQIIEESKGSEHEADTV